MQIRRFLLCIKNGGRAASLEVRKVYPSVPDPGAELTGLVRVIDESGEDYLYPADLFVPIELPEAVISALIESEG